EDGVADELQAEVLRSGVGRPGGEGLGDRLVDLFALTDVGGVAVHLRAVLLLEPCHDHGGVQTSGVGEHHLHPLAPILSSRATSSLPPVGLSATTRMVSSPATVPTTPATDTASMAAASRWAAP